MTTTLHRAEQVAPGVHVLGGWEPADRRISWVGNGVGRWLPFNCYLLTEGDEAMLVDTGVAAHERVVLDQLAGLQDDLSRMTLFVSRFGEFDSAGNAASLIGSAPVDRVLAHYPDPEHVVGKPHDGFGWLPTTARHDDLVLPSRLVCEPIDEATELFVDRGRQRAIELQRAPLRLLVTTWAFDRRTGTLFTSDALGHALLRDPDGGRIVDHRNDETTVEEVRTGLVGKFAWLLRGNPGPTRDALESFFATHEVHAIAPAFGGVLRGREVVDRHVRMLLDTLDQITEEQCA